MPTATLPILEHAATLSDPTRCRVLRLLERQELTVSELGHALQLPQSSTSRHLKTLADAGFVRARREGTSHWYGLAAERLNPAARKLWTLVREQMASARAHPQDLRRLDAVLAARPGRSRAFFAAAAGKWDRLRDELFGRAFDLRALAGLLDPGTSIGDLACGTGRVAEALAPFVRRVVAVDSSPAMLEAARRRLGPWKHVEVREGALESLPLADGSLDLATLFLALHHVAEPVKALAESRRVLRSGGRLLVVDMLPHDREEYRQQMGHVWLGFSEPHLTRDLASAGFEDVRFNPLPPDGAARGPFLFAATATRSDRAATGRSGGRRERPRPARRSTGNTRA